MEVVQTAADGSFRTTARSEVIRFFEDGYRPSTRLSEGPGERVVLERSRAAASPADLRRVQFQPT